MWVLMPLLLTVGADVRGDVGADVGATVGDGMGVDVGVATVEAVVGAVVGAVVVGGVAPMSVWALTVGTAVGAAVGDDRQTWKVGLLGSSPFQAGNITLAESSALEPTFFRRHNRLMPLWGAPIVCYDGTCHPYEYFVSTTTFAYMSAVLLYSLYICSTMSWTPAASISAII